MLWWTLSNFHSVCIYWVPNMCWAVFLFDPVQESPGGIYPGTGCSPNFTECWTYSQGSLCTGGMWGLLFPHTFVNTHCHQTFQFLPIWLVKSDFLISISVETESEYVNIPLLAIPVPPSENCQYIYIYLAYFSFRFPGVSLLLLLLIWSCFLHILHMWHLLVLDIENTFS